MKNPLEFALSKYGLAEVPGSGSNQNILDMAKSLGIDWYENDSGAGSSWCGIFLAYVHKETGVKVPKDFQVARNWLKSGRSIKHPVTGDVVVYWRKSKSSWQGHVGIFISYSEDSKYINTLGGNQDDQVSISQYSVDKLLGFRRYYQRKPALGLQSVKAHFLNIRAKGDPKAKKVAEALPKGTKVQVIKSVKGWDYVEVVNLGITGWVSSKFLS